MKKCFDAGTIQAFLDGELADDLQETVARHVAACDACALLLAEAEEETAFAFAALGTELDALVPTNRLWTKINDSIERETNGKSVWQTAFANFKNLFAAPSIAAFAGLLIVAALFLALRNTGTIEKETYVSQSGERENTAPQTTNAPLISSGEAKPPQPVEAARKNTPSLNDENKPRVVRASFVKAENARQSERVGVKSFAKETVAPEFVSGEETYVKTIATLEKTVNSRKDEVLKPSARFSFEKDLAVADDAIQKMKTAVKQNPKNEAAKQVLLASYQSKVDLLSSVAEKSELMASLK